MAAGFVGLLHAETGGEGWLRYAPVENVAMYRAVPRTIVSLGDTPTEQSAARELEKGLSRMLGRTEMVSAEKRWDAQSILIGTEQEIAAKHSGGKSTAALAKDGFYIYRTSGGYVIAGGGPEGVLYGAFRFLQLIAASKPLPADLREQPSSPIRWVNQWDNLDGSIERGYAGRSIFFDGGHVRPDLSRVGEYGRLLASVGINGVTVNNVNSDLKTLTPEMIGELAHIADALRPWGVRMSLSVDLSSPKIVGGLDTFDPLNATVAAWWQQKVDAIYQSIPDLAGFVVKADSEGRAGPSQYGRSPADAANVLARPLQRWGGVVLYRGFVYNHHLDWNDLKADRARAGYDNFRALDGKFEHNVVIQVKHGPIDFQVREPVSPLFGAMQHTAQAVELQVTQEYTGQQRHMVFLVPMWKTALDTDLRVNGQNTPVREIVEGKSFHQSLGGFVGVANVGLDTNWMHHPMAMANLYGYGRLAWNPMLTSEEIVDEWTRQTWGNSREVVDTIDKLQLESWKAYEGYTGPLGVGGLTEITGVHFGPGIESAERNGWGQWFRADANGIGMDRTVGTGTGYIGQYPPEVAAQYESLGTCPDELLLFMHHVPYSYVLHTKKTLIQHVYDSHYEGAAVAASYHQAWEELQGKIDAERYALVERLFLYQAGHAEVWRDAVNGWFDRESGIDDVHGRVGHHMGRVEAESAETTGYKIVDGTPWETASGGKAVICESKECSLRVIFKGVAAPQNIEVGYYDLRSGISRYTLLVNNKVVTQWVADDILPPAADDRRLDGHTATRFVKREVLLNNGDVVEIQAIPDGGERAPLDFVEITPTNSQKDERP
nr:alpha-glucuronidase family glycosyl hydrolase [Granulicella sp. dw_53]